MKDIDFLKGTWNITSYDFIENEWVQGESSTATFLPLLDGTVLQEAVKINGPKYQLDMINTISFDPFSQRFQLASIDKKFSYIDLFEGEYQAESRCLCFDNLKRGVPIQLEGAVMNFQISWTQVSDTKMTFLVESTTDGGDRWSAESKILYSR